MGTFESTFETTFTNGRVALLYLSSSHLFISVLYSFLIPFLWPLVIAYVTFVYFDKAPEKGGRRFEWTRKLPIWKYFVDYYPMSLVKEADLDPSKNYVFGYHPHGIISMGAFGNFATEATGFSDLFPGIKPSLLTLVSNFKLPLYRDIIMSLGIAAVSRRSCEYILSSGPGRSIVIVVGGAAESLSARPGIADLTLKKRLGFIRLAICIKPNWSPPSRLAKTISLNNSIMPKVPPSGKFKNVCNICLDSQCLFSMHVGFLTMMLVSFLSDTLLLLLLANLLLSLCLKMERNLLKNRSWKCKLPISMNCKPFTISTRMFMPRIVCKNFGLWNNG
ncbi:unnamed protein product [Absidia cylindrospora]